MTVRRLCERGSAAMFVVLTTVALLVAAGLVIDGGYAMAERRQLATQAEQAARIGADALDRASLRDGGAARVNPDHARTAAATYLRQVGAPPASINIDGDRVTVTIHSRADTAILSVAGVDSVPVHATGTARSIDEDTN